MQKDVIIIGAGAAGLMCAIEAAKRNRRVLVIDHANKVGKKILMSGGGYCNFTNTQTSPEAFQSANPHFCKSALSRYTQWDFIQLVESYQLAYHEKKLGQLFCDHKSKEIVDILLQECQRYEVEIALNTRVTKHKVHPDGGFYVKTERHDYLCQSLVVATGGLSIPTMGATGFGYELAKAYNITVHATRAGLVPFTLHQQDKERFAVLSGVSVAAIVSNERISFRENILFTHRGLSGPAILQISSYWQPGEAVSINLLPDLDVAAALSTSKQDAPTRKLKTFLEQHLPKRVIEIFVPTDLLDTSLAQLSHKQIGCLCQLLQAWRLLPNATEGNRTAEVTLGGVSTEELSSKTFESYKVPGLYFIGEVIDVTGWLGGYNFQWAWASGWAAGQVV